MRCQNESDFTCLDYSILARESFISLETPVTFRYRHSIISWSILAPSRCAIEQEIVGVERVVPWHVESRAETISFWHLKIVLIGTYTIYQKKANLLDQYKLCQRKTCTILFNARDRAHRGRQRPL